MKFVTRFILAFLIFSLNFDREGHAALNSGDVATPLYVQNFDVSDQATRPRGITFNNDGSKMYIVGWVGDDVNEYNLSANFDVSSPTFVQSYSFMTPTQASNLENQPTSVKFNNDGTKMFITGRGSNDLNEFILSTAYDVSTAEHETQLPFDSTDEDINAFDFNNDGTMLFITGTENELMHQFKVNVAFDLSEGVELVRTKDLPGLNDENNPSAGEDEPFNIEFNLDGTRMFVIGTKGNDVNQYSLSIAFNISTATLDGGLNIGNNPTGIAFSNSGLRMSAGLIGNFSGLFMSASAILWLTLLPKEDIDINEGVWDLGINFILTLVGGFLAIVAGIIALNAKKRGGRKRYNYHMPQQQNFQQQNFQQQNFQQQNFQQQNYQQQNYQQQQQFYEEQTQHYQQPDPYQRW